MKDQRYLVFAIARQKCCSNVTNSRGMSVKGRNRGRVLLIAFGGYDHLEKIVETHYLCVPASRIQVCLYRCNHQVVKNSALNALRRD